jgi:hypothetical protein
MRLNKPWTPRSTRMVLSTFYLGHSLWPQKTSGQAFRILHARNTRYSLNSLTRCVEEVSLSMNSIFLQINAMELIAVIHDVQSNRMLVVALNMKKLRI